MTTPEGCGVVMVPDPIAEVESAQYQLIADQERQGLRYESPDLGTLENVHPTLEMKGLLREYMKLDRMIDAVMTAW